MCDTLCGFRNCELSWVVITVGHWFGVTILRVHIGMELYLLTVIALGIYRLPWYSKIL